jgi:two-component system phosphate regulon sensor histidine kinase PhoR
MRSIHIAPATTELLGLLDTPSLLVRGDRIVFANPAALTLLGAHIEGQDVRLALRDPDALAILRTSEGGHVRVSGLSVSGSIWGLTSHALADGTRFVTLEDLSASASVARAHADFVANASHELRTPLATIIGYAETLSDTKAGCDPATRDRFLAIIKNEAARMQALVEDLMSLSRIEAVKHEAPRTPVDLIALAREAAGEVAHRASVEVVSSFSSAMVAGDRGQLAQVLRNLIDNAIKYGTPDIKVAIIITPTDSGWLSLCVKDNGEGIAPEHLPRLTERFYRADAGRSHQVGGTGLGLSIVKHIVERHRGRFDITSRLGEGTVASMVLPALSK